MVASIPEVAHPLGVVVNRRARRGGHRAALSALERVAGEYGVVAPSGDRAELVDIARDFHRRDVRVLAIHGGDGTAGFTLSVFRDVYGNAPLPRVALLYGGTMNTIARSLGVPKMRPARALERLVAASSNGGIQVRRRCSTLEVGAPAEAGHVGFLFGTGVGRAFLEEYYGAGGSHPTPWTATRTLTRFCASVLVQGPTARRMVRPEPLELTVDGRRANHGPYLAVMAGTVEQVGLGFRPFFGVRGREGAFHVLAIHGRPRDLLRHLPRAHRGVPMGPDTSQDAVASRVVLESPEGVVRYFVDGDLFSGPSPLELRVGPPVELVW